MDFSPKVAYITHVSRDRNRDEMLSALGPSEPLRECREKVVDGHRAATTRARPIGEVKLFEDKKVVFFCGDAPIIFALVLHS